MERPKNRIATILGLAILGIAAFIVTTGIVFLTQQKPHTQFAEIVRLSTFTPSPTPTEAPTPTPSPTETPALAPTPAPTPTPTPAGLIGGRYDVFSAGETVQDKTVYQSETVSITMTRYTRHPYKDQNLVYYVADVYLQDISSLRAGSPKGFDRNGYSTIQKLSNQFGAILAVNGDYPTYDKRIFVFRNGVQYRQIVMCCLCTPTAALKSSTDTRSTRIPWT